MCVGNFGVKLDLSKWDFAIQLENHATLYQSLEGESI